MKYIIIAQTYVNGCGGGIQASDGFERGEADDCKIAIDKADRIAAKEADEMSEWASNVRCVDIEVINTETDEVVHEVNAFER